MFWAVVVSALESDLESPLELVCIGWAEVHLYLCVSSLSQGSLQCDFGNERIQPYHFA